MAGTSKIQALKNTLGLGARANKYKVIINGTGAKFPLGDFGDILCKSTTLPGRSFADIEIWDRGRKITVAGQAQFDGTWTCTFLDNQKHELRGKIIDWMEYIDSVANHSREAPNHNLYMNDAILQQLSTIDNKVLAEYYFSDVYPKSLGESTYSDESQELIEFNVDFSYSLWRKTK